MRAPCGQILLSQLAERLHGESDIVLAIAFGSAANDKLRPDSDIDVAVLTSSPLTVERRRALTALVADATGRPVDLVDLSTSGVAVTRAALTQGRRLVTRDKAALARLLCKTLLDAADFLPYRQRILNERRASMLKK
jgi:predicted nucleotidyltransferase